MNIHAIGANCWQCVHLWQLADTSLTDLPCDHTPRPPHLSADQAPCAVSRRSPVPVGLFVCLCIITERLSTSAACHRRRLLEMTVGARFLFSSFHFSSPLFRPSSLPSHLFLLLLSPTSAITFLSALMHPLNPARRSGERCNLSLRVRARPGRQMHFAAFSG